LTAELIFADDDNIHISHFTPTIDTKNRRSEKGFFFPLPRISQDGPKKKRFFSAPLGDFHWAATEKSRLLGERIFLPPRNHGPWILLPKIFPVPTHGPAITRPTAGVQPLQPMGCTEPAGGWKARVTAHRGLSSSLGAHTLAFGALTPRSFLISYSFFSLGCRPESHFPCWAGVD
jgi:hypothetical protein